MHIDDLITQAMGDTQQLLQLLPEQRSSAPQLLAAQRQRVFASIVQTLEKRLATKLRSHPDGVATLSFGVRSNAELTWNELLSLPAPIRVVVGVGEHGITIPPDSTALATQQPLTVQVLCDNATTITIFATHTTSHTSLCSPPLYRELEPAVFRLPRVPYPAPFDSHLLLLTQCALHVTSLLQDVQQLEFRLRSFDAQSFRTKLDDYVSELQRQHNRMAELMRTSPGAWALVLRGLPALDVGMWQYWLTKARPPVSFGAPWDERLRHYVPAVKQLFELGQEVEGPLSHGLALPFTSSRELSPQRGHIVGWDVHKDILLLDSGAHVFSWGTHRLHSPKSPSHWEAILRRETIGLSELAEALILFPKPEFDDYFRLLKQLLARLEIRARSSSKPVPGGRVITWQSDIRDSFLRSELASLQSIFRHLVVSESLDFIQLFIFPMREQHGLSSPVQVERAAVQSIAQLILQLFPKVVLSPAGEYLNTSKHTRVYRLQEAGDVTAAPAPPVAPPVAPPGLPDMPALLRSIVLAGGMLSEDFHTHAPALLTAAQAWPGLLSEAGLPLQLLAARYGHTDSPGNPALDVFLEELAEALSLPPPSTLKPPPQRSPMRMH